MYSFLARDCTRHWPPPSQRSILAKSVSSSAWNQMPQIFETPSVVFRCLIFTVRMGFLSLTWQMCLGVFYEVSRAWISKPWFTNSKLIELNACSVSLTEYTSLQSIFSYKVSSDTCKLSITPKSAEFRFEIDALLDDLALLTRS